MPHCCCEWEDVYIRQKHLQPCCNVCDRQCSQYELRQKITRPVYRYSPRVLPCRVPETACCCSCICGKDGDLCLCYECRKVLGRSEATVHSKHRPHYVKYKYSLLQSWFNRFDSDGDGYLNLVDLKSLLEYLEIKVEDTCTKKILQTCDRDSDGRLSFPEFVHLWRCASLHDDQFLKTTGCHELSHVVKKYQLYPESRHCPCHDHRCKHVTLATEYPVHQIKCKCGQTDKVMPFLKQEYDEKKWSKRSHRGTYVETPEDLDYLPTFSHNRDNILMMCEADKKSEKKMNAESGENLQTKKSEKKTKKSKKRSK